MSQAISWGSLIFRSIWRRNIRKSLRLGMHDSIPIFIRRLNKLVADSFKAVDGKLNPNQRNNCFELYGYDFMITDDFNVLLIEVNTNP